MKTYLQNGCVNLIQYCPHCEKVLVKKKIDEHFFYTCSICGYKIEMVHEEPHIKKMSKELLEKRKAESMLIIVDEKLKPVLIQRIRI